MERKEAIEIVKNNFPYGRIMLSEALMTLIPELKEIDDEKIKKVLIDYFNKYKEQEECGIKSFYGIPTDKVIDWLEKQGGQKEIDYNEEINKCKSNPLYFIDKYVTVKLKEHNNSSLEKQGEQKPDLNEKDETNAPTEYGKYVDKCLNEASKHFFSEGEDKYSVADLFYAGIKCGQSWLEKQGTNHLMSATEITNSIGKSIASSLINYLDDNRYEGAMNMSNIECEDLEKAIFDLDWGKMYCYMQKKLEKQGEQESTDNIEPKFKVGDWVVGEGCICKVIDIRGRFYRLYFPDGKTGNIDIYYADEKFHHWTIEDAKDGDVISYDDGWTCIFKCIHGIWFSSHCFITDEGEFYMGYERHEVDSTIRSNINPSTKEQCDLLFQKMEEAGYKWDVNRKEMVSISKDE